MTEKKYIVALDQGTTSSRAVVMDHDANIISAVSYTHLTLPTNREV